MNSQWLDDPTESFDDDEYPTEDFDDESSDLTPCPECGNEIYEDAERCPICGTYVTFSRSLWAGRPVWWVMLGLAGILAVILLLALGP